MRFSILVRGSALGLAAVTLLSACGPEPEEPASSDEPSSTSISPGESESPSDADSPGDAAVESKVNAELSIDLTESKGGQTKTFRLACVDGAAKDSGLRDPQRACNALGKHAKQIFFTPPDKNKKCTEQYGGPQTARVTGTVGGEKVDAQFSLINGCEISRWNALRPLLNNAGGAV